MWLKKWWKVFERFSHLAERKWNLIATVNDWKGEESTYKWKVTFWDFWMPLCDPYFLWIVLSLFGLAFNSFCMIAIKSTKSTHQLIYWLYVAYHIHYLIGDSTNDNVTNLIQQIFFGIILASDSLAKTPPFLDSFASARGSGIIIFKIIDRISKIDPMSNDGKVLNWSLQGNIAFKSVHFSYPSRPDAKVRKNWKTYSDWFTLKTILSHRFSAEWIWRYEQVNQ